MATPFISRNTDKTSLFINCYSPISDFVVRFQESGGDRINFRTRDISPTDNRFSLGRSNSRWSEVFAVNSSINTSDENEKIIDNIPDNLLDAADKIKPIRFKWIEEEEKYNKGLRLEEPRWHIGYSAQSVFKAFKESGIEDPWKYALLCKNPIEEHLKNGEIVSLLDKNGSLLERWGLRVTELNILKIAAQSRRIEQLIIQ